MAEYGMTGAPAYIGLAVAIAIVVGLIWWKSARVKKAVDTVKADAKGAADNLRK